jgi:dihydrofolate synthase/folylpolyglutamate synthase
MISEDDWMRIYQQYEAFFEKENLTMFEIDLWMAMAYFLEQKVDIALIEVGLGGRLDATTALDYNLVMITNVGLEHCAILGDTIEQISYEKAGIFKPGYVALTTETKPNAKKVMEQVAGYMGTLLGFVEIPFKETGDHQVLFEWQDHTYVLHPPKYQIYNLSLALEGLNYLGYTLKPDCVQSVIDHFHWAGRFTIARKDPLIILDGAHNKEGIEALVASLGHFDGHIYFSVLKDKKAKEMLNVLETLHCPITLVSMDTARLYDLQTLNYPIINEKQLMVELQNTKDHTLVCGSLYFIGDFYKAFTNK